MATGRKPQHDKRSFGGEMTGVVSAALAVFLLLAFYSYRPGDPQSNLVGVAGYRLADLWCPAFGQSSYLVPLLCIYSATVLLHLLPCPAPFSQLLAFTVFTFATAATLALWFEGRPVVQGGG